METHTIFLTAVHFQFLLKFTLTNTESYLPPPCSRNLNLQIIPTQDSNIIIFHFYSFQQDWMELIFDQFPRMRDFYTRPDPVFLECNN